MRRLLFCSYSFKLADKSGVGDATVFIETTCRDAVPSLSEIDSARETLVQSFLPVTASITFTSCPVYLRDAEEAAK